MCLEADGTTFSFEQINVWEKETRALIIAKRRGTFSYELDAFIILSKQATKNPLVNVSSDEARRHARVLSVCPRLDH